MIFECMYILVYVHYILRALGAERYILKSYIRAYYVIALPLILVLTIYFRVDIIKVWMAMFLGYVLMFS